MAPDETSHDGSKPNSADLERHPKRLWWTVVKRSAREARDDRITDLAAAMTFYAVLALFPALIVLVSLVALVGDPQQTTQSLLNMIDDIMPSSASGIIDESLQSLAQSGSAGALLSVGLLGAIWSSAGYIGAFTRAMNAIYEVDEGRPFWKLKPLQIVLTLAVLVAAALLGAALVLSGPVARSVGGFVGLSDAAVTAWNYGKWPVMVVIVALGLAILYWLTPNVEHPRFRWLTPGSLIAVLLSILASLGFAFYAANFGKYNATYGSLGAVIIFLVWLWIINLSFLVGAEIDAEYERIRQHARGQELEQAEPDEERRRSPDAPGNDPRAHHFDEPDQEPHEASRR